MRYFLEAGIIEEDEKEYNIKFLDTPLPSLYNAAHDPQ
jgi:hypothetical protein